MGEKKITNLETAIVTLDQVERRIYEIRGHTVLIDRELATLYGVETRVLKQAVRRNLTRFPDDFMFVLNTAEFLDWRSHFVTSNSDRMGLRHPPMAFTEQGVAMLSSILNSERAVQVNIAIMRAFVNMRRLVATNDEINKKLATIEKKLGDHDGHFKEVFAALRAMTKSESKSAPIGYIRKKK